MKEYKTEDVKFYKPGTLHLDCDKKECLMCVYNVIKKDKSISKDVKMFQIERTKDKINLDEYKTSMMMEGTLMNILGVTNPIAEELRQKALDDFAKVPLPSWIVRHDVHAGYFDKPNG